MNKILYLAQLCVLTFVLSCSTPNSIVSTNQITDTTQVANKALSSQNIQDVNAPSSTTGVLWKYWYRDFDKDGFGANTVDAKNPLYKKKQPIGYIDRSGDCNDSNSLITSPIKYFMDNDKDGFGGEISTELCTLEPGKDFSSNSLDCNDFNSEINPNKIEVWNGLDDNCNTLIDEGLTPPGIVITSTKSLIPEYMGAGGSSQLFGNPNNNPDSQSFLDLVNGFKFSSYTGAVEGHESEYSHFKLPYGTKGSGYNPPLPCDPRPMNGELCKTYPQDFFISWLSLLHKTNTKGVYVANIQSGSLEDIYYYVDQFPNQASYVIALGLESSSSQYPVLNSKTYVIKYYDWINSIQSKYPEKKFYFLADIPEVKLNNGKYSPWIQDFLNYKPLDSTKVSIRQYYHGFNQYGNLTGDAAKDSSIYTKGVLQFPKTIDATELAFKGCPIYVAQFSTDVPAYISGTPIHWRCVDMFYYMRAYNVMIDRNTSGDSKFIGSSVIGIKLMFNSLNYKWLGVFNNMYSQPRYSCTVTHNLGSQVDMQAGVKVLDSKYSILIQNRSGNEIALPEYFLVDGKYEKPTYSYSQGVICATLSSTTGVDYNPLINLKLPPFGIVYLEF
jgi:hypothetical protein